MHQATTEGQFKVNQQSIIIIEWRNPIKFQKGDQKVRFISKLEQMGFEFRSDRKELLPDNRELGTSGKLE